MTISRAKLAEVVAGRTLHITDSKKLASEIAAYLLEENLTTDLESLLRDVRKFRLEQHGIVEVDVVSAHKLSAQDLSDVNDLLRTEYPHAKKYYVDERIDESVVGGIKFEFPGAQLDLSIFSRLNLFKRHVVAEKGTK